MSRIVLRGAFEARDIQVYREVDLDFLLNGLLDRTVEENRQNSAQGQESADPSCARPTGFPTDREQPEWILAEIARQAETLKEAACKQCNLEDRESVKKEMGTALGALSKVAEELGVLREEWVSRFAPQIAQLALEVAEKIVGKQVEEDPQIVASVLARAKVAVPSARDLRIFLNPADYHALLDLRPDLLETNGGGLEKMEIIPSEDIGRGGCRVETDAGVVDATVSTQLEEIRRQMLEE
ncbi:MAG: hypothetical protein HY695_21265 [Deltaproteobacteria bacterium]|nr:hypothetical protein [Deltaproteobacteria bacterium]